MSDGGISDNAIVNEVRHEPTGGQGGWASLGRAFGGGFGGAGTLQGETAYENGMRIGAQTVDALAQAKQRVQANESANQAADMLNDPEVQKALGLSGPLSGLFQTRLRAGDKIEDVMKSATEAVHFKNRTMLADPSIPLEQRHAAANSEDPASLTPKAEGPLGSVFDPGANHGSGATTVGDLQQKNTQSEIDLRGAQAKAAGVNAGAHVTSANASAANSGPFGKPPIGTRYQMKPDNNGDPSDPSNYVLDNTGRPAVERIPGLVEAKGEGQVNTRNTRRVNNATNMLAAETKILGKIGFDASSEAQGAGAVHGLMGVASENLGKSLSSEQAQNYRSSLAGVSNQLGILELVGGVPPGAYTNQLEKAIKNDSADTNETRMQHAALIRQIVEVAAHTAEDNPAMDPQYKAAIVRSAREVQKNIPFTASEVQAFRAERKPGQTFQQFLDSHKREETETFGDYGGASPKVDHAAPVGAAPAPTAPSQSDPLGILGK